MKQKRWIAAVAAVVLLAAAWAWGYRAVNDRYAPLIDKVVTYYDQVGQKVPFGPNGFDTNTIADGYFIRVDGVEFVDYDVYSQTISLAETAYPEECDEVALVTVTLFNEESEAQGVMLTDIMLHCVNNCFYMNWGLLTASNPILEGNYGICLPQGTSCQLVLPYSMFEWNVGMKLLEHPERFDMWLMITSYPEEIHIRVQ